MTVTDADLALAEALGRAAARDGLFLSDNPYPRDRRVERARWALAHAGVTAERSRAAS